MKVLVIPDIHCRKFWRNAIINNISKVDKVVFLGDYIDPYPNEIKKNPELMECKSFDDAHSIIYMLLHIISLKQNEPNKYILLTGNHTDSYIWSKFSAASRTDYKNWEKYHKFFSENLNLFNLVWIEDNVIFSHAGISEEWATKFSSYNLKLDDQKAPFTKRCAELLKNTSLKDFNIDYIKGISDISYYRGGDAMFGSCEWADIREHISDFYDDSGIIPKGTDDTYQIFGHTQLAKDPIITDKWACLDCRKGFIIDTITHKIEECDEN